jgi:excisionase family DNA binding protein
MFDDVSTTMETPAGPDYLHPREVAQLLCVTARTVSRWADQGRIPHIVTLGGHRRFRRADVLRLRDQSHRNEDAPLSSTG